ncbi:MAG: VWA domain-containing protein [Phycisphaerae bacterium]|nr:VWA domain-containing protein [Phycisphaerae bacterium]
MTFTHPWVLLVLAIPVLLGWMIVVREAGLVLPSDHEPSGAGGAGRGASHSWIRGVLAVFEAAPLVVLAAAIVMLAGPQVMKQPRRERLLTNIQICMDVSGSMTGRNYELASSAIEDFTHAREGDAFGLTLFGTEQIRWLPLTKDLQAVRNAMPFADPSNQPSHMGGTRIGAALRFCRGNMEAEGAEGDRMIILVSDGFSADLGGGQEDEVAGELEESGIVVYYIHIGESEAPTETTELARRTGGESFRASDDQSIKAVFRHIDRMKPAKYASVGTVPMDHFGPFALAALAALGLHGLGLLGMRYTPW